MLISLLQNLNKQKNIAYLLSYLASKVPEHKFSICHFSATDVQSHGWNNSIRRKAFHIWVHCLHLLQQSLQKYYVLYSNSKHHIKVQWFAKITVFEDVLPSCQLYQSPEWVHEALTCWTCASIVHKTMKTSLYPLCYLNLQG